jgi:DNA helicase-2/ATP-dependent DNA helicase PcrA
VEPLSNLNQAQLTAVTAESGPILVLAGPGSGKTRVLTHRIAYLIQEQGVEPWRIMAVTFTNKAAREMIQRVSVLLGGDPKGMTLGTFHATCVRLLRRESDALSQYDANFLIFDTDDQRRVVAQAMKDLNIDDSRFQPTRLLNSISKAKNEIVTADNFASYNYVLEVTRRVYQRYQEMLVANNAMDFDDLLMNTVLLLDDNPAILQRYQQRYEHILVDEFQDTNTVQYELLIRLSALHKNIFVVGDADQSIYRWRGADFRNITRFREHFSQSQQILLEQNYRSTQIILDAAKAVIRQNHDRVDKELFTDRSGGELIRVSEAYNETDEANAILDIITELEFNNMPAGGCAIMYRTNAQSRVLEEAFLRAGRNYRLVGATRFYSRREVKDIIAYLRLVYSPSDSVSFARVINTPTRGIGRKTLELFYRWADQNNWRPGEALRALASQNDLQHPFSGRAHNALSHFGKKLNAWIELSEQITVEELIDTILSGIDFRAYLDDGTEAGRDRWDNVVELRGVAIEHEDDDLGQFLEHVTLVSDVDNMEDSSNVPTLLTLHSAKGLEFPVVFIIGLVDGTLPHSRSLSDGEELAEERRLFYVGLTRAKERIFLSYAFRRMSYGESEVTVPSRFLNDIPFELIEGGDIALRRQKTVQKASSWDWTPPSSSRRQRQRIHSSRKDLPEPNVRTPSSENPRPPILTEVKYRTGQNVYHSKFGEGVVIESKLTGSDEEVIVAFSEQGIKKLVASLAKLEIRD